MGSSEILAYGARFNILNTRKHDDGKYICTARNYLGSDSREVTLNVQSKFNIMLIMSTPTRHRTIFPNLEQSLCKNLRCLPVSKIKLEI